MPPPKGKIRVRMYHVGFGDGFLVSFPRRSGGHDHVLIDFGVHMRGQRKNALERIFADIKKETLNEIALVIATHEHQDHLAGLAQFADGFANMQVREVWLPWTSNPNDPQARKLKKKQLALTDALEKRFAAAPPSEPALAAVENAKSNARAMRLLQGDLKVTPKYLSDNSGALKAPGGIAGLTARVLGPPEDPALLGSMDPPAGHHFFTTATGRDGNIHPFPGMGARKGALTAMDEKALVDAMSTSDDELAFALDSAINNTSIVALFEFGAQSLLFAGDAQWGNWKGWALGEDGKDLLSKITFYKVAHHGSYNATPSDAVEAMNKDGFAAMMSTQSTPFPTIPRKPLLEQLEKRGARLARSDKPAPKGFVEGPDWIDWIASP